MERKPKIAAFKMKSPFKKDNKSKMVAATDVEQGYQVTGSGVQTFKSVERLKKLGAPKDVIEKERKKQVKLFKESKESPMKFGYRYKMSKKLRSDYPKTFKAMDKVTGKIVGRAVDVATGGGFSSAKRYIKKQGGPKATFVKVMNKIAPPKKNKK